MVENSGNMQIKKVNIGLSPPDYLMFLTLQTTIIHYADDKHVLR